MNSVDFETKILDAIETIVDNTISKANYDKTIKGIVIERTDATVGKYKIKYQDSEIEAYSNNIDIFYPAGTIVNILIPGNDFSQNKIILDAIEKDKIEYSITLEEENEYSKNGNNIISSEQSFGLCSYKTEDIKILYDVETGINSINVDNLTFSNYIKNNNTIICGAEFQTQLNNNQKSSGDFGVIYELNFKDNLTGNIITKTYKVNIDIMKGTPYNQNTFTRQCGIFDINTDNFIEVKKIYIYSKNFPNQSEEITKEDIFVKNFELYAANKISQDEINNYNLNLFSDSKTYFDYLDPEDVSIKINAEVQFKNILITEGIQFFWFKENNLITTNDIEYNKYGGIGWECINNYNVIDEYNREYLSNINSLIINKSDVISSNLLIKCVAVKNNKILAINNIDIKNYNANYTIEIVSDSGNQFYYDNGNPTIICKINGEEDANYIYKWSYIDNNGVYSTLEETITENEEYNTAAENYALLKSQIETEKIMPVANENQLEQYLAILNSYKYTQRVEKNIIHKIDLTKINQNGTFKCSVWEGNNYIGTAAIIIFNNLFIEGDYHLEIINGIQTFKYNGMGISPSSLTLDKPIQIQPLSFTIVDNNGNVFGDKILESCEIEWIVPQENTLLIGRNSNNLILNYSIAEKYDISKLNNNTIQLKVKYKDLLLMAETSFTFIKEGEPGTNGSEILCKIVPNTTDAINDYPMIINGELNFTPASSGKWLEIQLWKNGELLWHGVDSEGECLVEWRVLKNQYTDSIGDSSSIDIQNNTFSYLGYNSNAANIIKGIVTYNGINYYSTIPIITVTTINSDYNIKLIKDTGFRYVVYTSDGRNPQYDNTNPFTIQVTKNINGYIEDISSINNEYKLIYLWNIKGQIYDGINSLVDDHHLIGDNSTNNTKIFVPSDEFNGENVTNALEVEIKNISEETIGRIHIPIHFYLYRYGIAALNDWDGNKITLNDELGSILAPQVGAGKKNNSGQFTGVLMGTVKESGKPITEEGLFGYNKGQRTIFLDANSGKAEFGATGQGQIILDPVVNKAQLYSGNYSTVDKTGMLIDLTTPEINFGSGNFKVTKEGYLTAKGGGSIAGWNINNTKLSKGKVGISSDNSSDNNYAFWAGNTTSGSAPFSVTFGGVLKATQANVKGEISANAGNIGNWYINDGAIKYNNENNFYLNKNGSVKFGNFTVDTSGNVVTSGQITANAGSKIGPWNVTDSAIYNGKSAIGNNNNNGVYIGIDGIGLGSRNNYGTSSETDYHAKFEVTNTGALYSSNAIIAGKITATTGKIAGWTIDGNKLLGAASEDNQIILDGAGNISNNNGIWYINRNGAAKFGNFSITSAGNATLTGTVYAQAGTFGNGTNKVTIGGGSSDTNSNIHSGSKTSLNSTNNGFYIGTDGISLGAYDSTNGNPFQVTTSGSITARSGTVGGWTLSASSLHTTNNALYLGTSAIAKTINGTSRNVVFSAGTNFGVASDGTLYANSAILSGTLTAGNGSKLGNWNITNSAIKYNDNTYLGSDGSIKFGGGNFTVDTSGNVSATNLRATGGTFTNITVNGDSNFTGTINASNGYLGNSSNGWHIASTRLYNGGLDGNNGASLYSDGRLYMKNNYGWINSGSGGNFINGSGVEYPVWLSDNPSCNSTGGSSATIGIRSWYGDVRIASDYDIVLAPTGSLWIKHPNGTMIESATNYLDLLDANGSTKLRLYFNKGIYCGYDRI